tara:strand:- start:25811 stop:27076 length:1266 start_codon:yes stop_codon:yes gene_type:complete
MAYKTQLLPTFFSFKSVPTDFIDQNGGYSCVDPTKSCNKEMVEELTVVVDEDTGFIIPSVFDYLLTRHKEGRDNSSFESRALRLYFDFIDGVPELNWSAGSSISYERPIYQFSKFLEELYGSGQIAGTTAKNYFSSVVRFYTHHLKFSYPFTKGVPVEYTETIIKKFDNDLTSHISGLEIKIQSADCKPNIPSTKATELIPFTPEEQELFFLSLLKNGSQELLLMCLLAMNSGMRADEIADLRIDMISRYADEDSFKLKLGPLSEHRTKKDSEMPVQVSGRTIAALLRYNKSKRYLKRLAKSTPSRPHVFLNKNGEPYTQKMISTLFNEFMNKYIIPANDEFYHKFHDLRVTFGVDTMKACIDSGWSKKECLAFTKTQMRHKYLKDTLLYLEHWQSSVALKKQATVNEGILEEVFSALEGL